MCRTLIYHQIYGKIKVKVKTNIELFDKGTLVVDKGIILFGESIDNLNLLSLECLNRG